MAMWDGRGSNVEEFFRFLPGIHIELDDGLMPRHITAINVHIITVLGVCTAISSRSP